MALVLRTPTTAARPARLAVALVLVVAVGLALGGLTSVAQGALPGGLSALANSSATWTLLTVAIVAACRERPLPSALFGAASLVALVLGYQLVSTWRGFPTSEEFFLLAAVVVGPFVGAAASWSRRTDLRAALAVGLVAGITAGESAYGLLVVVTTNGWAAWVLLGAAGLVLLAAVLRRLHGARDRVVAVAVTAGVALAFLGAYQAAGALAF